MRRFLRGLGIGLMIYGVIGVVAILFNAVSMVRDMTGTRLQNTIVTIFMLAFCAGLFFAGAKLRDANAERRGGKAADAPQSAGTPSSGEDGRRPSDPAKAAPASERKEMKEQAAPVHSAASDTAESEDAVRLREEKRRRNEALLEERRREAEKRLEERRQREARKREEENRRIGELQRKLELPEGLSLSRNPFEGLLSRIGPDGLTDRSGVKMWLKAQSGADALETLRALTGWIGRFGALTGDLKSQFADVWWIVFSPLGYIYVVLTEDEHALDGRREAAKALCEGRNIWYAAERGEGLIDLITGRAYALEYEEWPGSADDAATYGEWDLNETKDKGAAETQP